MADAFEPVLRARLLADSAVKAIVVDRVDWNERPQESLLAAVTLLVVYDPRTRHMKDFTGYRGIRLQVDCWAWDGPTKRALREAVLAVLAAPGTFDGVRFGALREITVRDLGEGSPKGFRHRDSIDAVLWTDG